MSKVENGNEYIVIVEKEEGSGLIKKSESNDSEMNQEAGKPAVDEVDENKDIYAFNPPKQTGTVIAMITCASVSIGFIYFVIINLGILLYSADYIRYAAIRLLVSVGVILLNIVLFGVMLSYIVYCRRYRRYIDVLNCTDIIVINDLAHDLDMKQEKVVKDLLIAVRRKFIPQGHFSEDNTYFILTDEKYEKYVDKQDRRENTE